jgi:hypothetical protein
MPWVKQWSEAMENFSPRFFFLVLPQYIRENNHLGANFEGN